MFLFKFAPNFPRNPLKLRGKLETKFSKTTCLTPHPRLQNFIKDTNLRNFLYLLSTKLKNKRTWTKNSKIIFLSCPFRLRVNARHTFPKSFKSSLKLKGIILKLFNISCSKFSHTHPLVSRLA